MRREENRSTRGKTSHSRVENQQTQPTSDAESGNRTRATSVGGECPHYYTTTALQVAFFNVDSHFLLLTEQLQAYKQASIKHTQAKEELAVSLLLSFLVVTQFRNNLHEIFPKCYTFQRVSVCLTDTFALAQFTTTFERASLTGYSFVYFLP